MPTLTKEQQEDALENFPELGESEDERIRKEMITAFSRLDEDSTLCGVAYNYKKWIAWLEKQGDKSTTIPKWKYKNDNTPLLRDSIILNKYGCVAKSPSGAIISDAWVLDYDELAKLPKEEFEKQGEQKPVDKVESKFKVGDWVVISTKKGDRVVQIASVEYFKNGYPMYITTEGRWFGNGTKARLLTDKDVEITTIPESKVIVNKIKSWSEEDDAYKEFVISAVEDFYDEKNPLQKTLIDWLKSLKDRIGE